MLVSRWYVGRILHVMPTLLGVTLVAFVIIRCIPGDPVLIMLGENVTPELYEQTRKALGLDAPLYLQYSYYVRQLIIGDWGKSIMTGEPVLHLVLYRFVNTFQLALIAIVFGSIFGVTMGILAAIHRGSRLDTILNRLISLSGISIPIFWSGLLLMLVFSVWLGLLPTIGGGSLRHLVLPSIALVLYTLGMISRVSRSALLDVITEDYIVTAHAKGLERTRILFAHIVRTALIPIVTVIGLQFGALVGGAIITENVFAYPGLGLLVVDSIFRRDYPVIQGSILIGGIAVALTNLIIDFLYALLDPRVQYQRG